MSSASTGNVRSPSILNGTYRFVVTRADALAFGPPASDPENLKALPAASTWTLRDGKFLGGGDPPEVGTYSVTGNRIAFHDVQFAYPLIFTFRVDHSGTLHLTPVQPMDRGDQFVWSVRPWRRIGPPSGKISVTRRRLTSPVAERDLGGETRPAPPRARDEQRAAERLDAVGQAAEPGPGGEVRTADAVVRDLDTHEASVAVTATTTREAEAYFTTFARASEQRK